MKPLQALLDIGLGSQTIDRQARSPAVAQGHVLWHSWPTSMRLIDSTFGLVIESNLAGWSFEGQIDWCKEQVNKSGTIGDTQSCFILHFSTVE